MYPDLPSLTSIGEPTNGRRTFGRNRHPNEDAASPLTRHYPSLNRGLGARPDAIAHPLAERASSVGRDRRTTSQCAIAGDSQHQSSHLDEHSLQNSRSCSSLTDHQPARSQRSQNSWQSTTIEHEFTPGVSEEIYEFRHYAFAPQDHVSALPSSDASFEIVFEDPLNPQYFREKRVRSRSEIEKQKDGIRLLKEFGGSCVWCFRSKKRCGPAHPCQSCAKGGRKCIRSPEQLCLLVPSTTSQDTVVMQPPSRDALDMLHDLARNAFLEGTVSVGVHLRRPGDDGLETWLMDITEADLDLSKSTQCAVSQFVDKSMAYVHCPQLRSLEESYGHHPLAHAALKMVSTFAAMSCLTKSCIHLQSSAADVGRLTIFLILVVGSRNLAEASESFCADLCEALRRKDLYDTYSTGGYRPRGKDLLNPVWVATALYYRMVCGLLDLERNSRITKIFGSLETQLVGVRKTLWSILKSIKIDNTSKSKQKPKDTLSEQIPPCPFSRHFDVAFWLGTIDSSDAFAPSGLLKRQGDPFAVKGHNMETFLENPALHPGDPSRAPQPIRWEPSLTLSNPPHSRSVSDHSSLSETSTSLSMMSEQHLRPNRNIIEPFQPTPWDTMGSIDSIHSDLDDCE